MFNLTLMNKLIRMEWVSEWVSAIELPSKLMEDYVIHEQKWRTDITWNTAAIPGQNSPLLALSLSSNVTVALRDIEMEELD